MNRLCIVKDNRLISADNSKEIKQLAIIVDVDAKAGTIISWGEQALLQYKMNVFSRIDKSLLNAELIPLGHLPLEAQAYIVNGAMDTTGTRAGDKFIRNLVENSKAGSLEAWITQEMNSAS